MEEYIRKLIARYMERERIAREIDEEDVLIALSLEGLLLN